MRVPTTWSFSADVNASPDEVYGWLSDYREDDHSRDAFLDAVNQKTSEAGRRTIVGREGDVVRIEDHWGRRVFRVDAHLRPATREIHLKAAHGYDAVWRAVPEAGGTRVEVEGRFEPTGLLRLLSLVFAKGFVKQLRKDFEGHVAEMRQDLEGASA